MLPRVPKPKTLAKYGLTPARWRAIAAAQGNVCFICKKLPENGRLCIDHEHVKGWKNLTPEWRADYVRGLLCFFCNKFYCGRGITIEKARNLVLYLERAAQ